MFSRIRLYCRVIYLLARMGPEVMSHACDVASMRIDAERMDKDNTIYIKDLQNNEQAKRNWRRFHGK